MKKEEQKKLLTEIMDADAKDGLYKQQTAVEWLEQEFMKGETILPILFKEAKAMEEAIIKNAIMYTLDEDGHTGDWKIKFANDYIKQFKNKQ